MTELQPVIAGAADSNWHRLCTIGGWMALLIPVIYLGAAVVNAIGYQAAPFPETITE